MARISYPDAAMQSDEVRDRLQRTGSLNVTRMMSHAPGVMMAYSRLGTQLLLRGALDPVLREIVILRIGQLCRSEYEWHQHSSVARAVGMDEATLAGIAAENFTGLTEPQQIGIRIAEEIKHDNCASEATIARAGAFFTAEQIVELCLVAGYYIMTAGFLRSLDVEVETTPPLGDSMAAGATA
jgi:alkylhydroperoxidase family enzyme